MSVRKPTYVVDAGGLLSSGPRELWNYRELFVLLVKRDFVAAYKQTVLGPLWFFVQPFLAALVYVVVFGQIARLPTSDLPPLVFYMSGFIAWNFFANCLSQVAYTFLGSGGLFRKIYFPRLVIPLSQISVNLLNFLAQFLTLLLVITACKLGGAKVDLSPRIALLPLWLLEMAGLALGLGCLIASATVRYRDLNLMVGYTLQLWMYGSLVIYSRPSVPDHLQGLLLLNPMASLIECYRSSLFGTEHAPPQPALIAALIILVILAAGLWRFMRAEGTFTDSI